METYEQLLEDFMPMIYSAIRRWHLGNRREDYLQVGRIALYEAWKTYDETRGPFPPYAKSYVYGRIRQELERTDRWAARNVVTEPVAMAETSPTETDAAISDLFITDWLARHPFTERERTWLTEHLFFNLKPKEIARKYGVSVETVKSWRKCALKKCRACRHDAATFM